MVRRRYQSVSYSGKGTQADCRVIWQWQVHTTWRDVKVRFLWKQFDSFLKKNFLLLLKSGTSKIFQCTFTKSFGLVKLTILDSKQWKPKGFSKEWFWRNYLLLVSPGQANVSPLTVGVNRKNQGFGAALGLGEYTPLVHIFPRETKCHFFDIKVNMVEQNSLSQVEKA